MHKKDNYDTPKNGRDSTQLTEEIKEILRNDLIAVFEESNGQSFTFRFPGGEKFRLTLTKISQ